MKNRQKSHPLKKLRGKICLVCQQEYRTEAKLEDFFNILATFFNNDFINSSSRGLSLLVPRTLLTKMTRIDPRATPYLLSMATLECGYPLSFRYLKTVVQ